MFDKYIKVYKTPELKCILDLYKLKPITAKMHSWLH